MLNTTCQSWRICIDGMNIEFERPASKQLRDQEEATKSSLAYLAVGRRAMRRTHLSRSYTRSAAGRSALGAGLPPAAAARRPAALALRDELLGGLVVPAELLAGDGADGGRDPAAGAPLQRRHHGRHRLPGVLQVVADHALAVPQQLHRGPLELRQVGWPAGAERQVDLGNVLRHLGQVHVDRVGADAFRHGVAGVVDGSLELPVREAHGLLLLCACIDQRCAAEDAPALRPQLERHLLHARELHVSLIVAAVIARGRDALPLLLEVAGAFWRRRWGFGLLLLGLEVLDNIAVAMLLGNI
mmetsp:Transcript_1037/g.2792  ORF Transcript_1037/g.2792 Transcript_1037/m.2792 type:complete len:300 (-) Transcript_1037:421-1320(-)